MILHILFGVIGIIIGMLIEGTVHNKKIDYADVVKRVLDTPITSLPAPHPVHGHQHYLVTFDAQTLYDGFDSDEAYKAWMELEHNYDKYRGVHSYIVDGKPKSVKKVT